MIIWGFKSRHLNQLYLLLCERIYECIKGWHPPILNFKISSILFHTKTEYSGPNFDRMDRINWSSSFVIPQFLRKSTSDLNLVMNSSIVSNSLGLNEINSFSNWYPLRSSLFLKRDSILIHTSLGNFKTWRWKISSGEGEREREKEKEIHKLHPSCYAMLLSQQVH